MKRKIHFEVIDMTNPDEHNTVLLSNLPSLTWKRYSTMNAYKNQWRVEDGGQNCFTTFDSGVACFKANPHSGGSSNDYFGLLRDIILLDYGKLKTPITLFICQWKKRHDNHGNNTYIRVFLW